MLSARIGLRTDGGERTVPVLVDNSENRRFFMQAKYYSRARGGAYGGATKNSLRRWSPAF